MPTISDATTNADASGDDEPVEDVQEVESAPFRYSITSYGADYPVDGLVKRIESDSIFIPPFQREYVWNQPQASRFVESLLLGLPVPGVFFSKETDTERLLVIDGQQRLRTLQFFYSGTFGDRKFVLRDVQKRFEGKTYKTLETEDRRRLDDAIIHATIIRQEEPSADSSSVYYIFERLNTGGTALNPQEIRACLYHGEFNVLLGTLNGDQNWRALFGKKNSRMKDQEMILRFFAMFFEGAKYERPMKTFLSGFMGKNRHLKATPSSDLESLFRETVAVLNTVLGPKAIRPAGTLNAAVLEGVMVGVAARLAAGPISDPASMVSAHAALMANADFVTAYTKATADEESVRTRLSLSRATFAAVK